MSLQTRPLYIPIDAAAVGTLANGSATAITEAKTQGKVLSSLPEGTRAGAVTHVGFNLSSSGGVVVVNLYEDAARTLPIASVSLTPATIAGHTLVYASSALSGADGVPFRAGLWWEAVGDVTSINKTGTLYLKVKGIR